MCLAVFIVNTACFCHCSMFRSAVLVLMENKGLYIKLHWDGDYIVHVCNKSLHVNSLIFSCLATVFSQKVSSRRVTSRHDVLMFSCL
jgi:hypothetical protein